MAASGGRLVSLVVAAAANDAIGIDNRLPWHLPEDLAHFRRLTVGKPVIMGRLTHESIGRALPDRRNIVLSRDPGFRADGCEVAASLHAALAMTSASAEVMIIGGARLYAEALPYADRIYLTRLHRAFDGDAFFPALDGRSWLAIAREDHPAGADREFGFSFLTLARREA